MKNDFNGSHEQKPIAENDITRQFQLSSNEKFISNLQVQKLNFEHIEKFGMNSRDKIQSIGDLKKLLAIAEGGLMKINDNLIAMQKKALQASSDGIILAERFIIAVKFQHLNDDIDRIVRETTFGKFALFNGRFFGHEFIIENGKSEKLHISLKTDLSTSALKTRNLRVNTAQNASHALEIIENGIRRVSKMLQQVGEWINQILFKDDGLEVTAILRKESTSKNQEYDLQSAREKLDSNKFQIMQHTAIAMIERSNSNSACAKLLFRNPELNR